MYSLFRRPMYGTRADCDERRDFEGKVYQTYAEHNAFRKTLVFCHRSVHSGRRFSKALINIR